MDTRHNTAHAAAWREHEKRAHSSSGIHHHHSHAPASQHGEGHHLLQVENLSIGFNRYEPQAGLMARKSRVDVIHALNIAVHRGELLALVGASGAGKTLLANTLLGRFEPNACVEGCIWFDGQLQSQKTLAQLRGRCISLVPQSVLALDPLMKVGRQLAGGGRRAGVRGRDSRARTEKQCSLFEHYGLGEAVAGLYPFELSGGMARRVLLCTALMDDPELIIADEPTPGLDLELAVRATGDLRAFVDRGGSVLLITHDIELALRVADRVAVFQGGTVIEETAVENFASPATLRQPFTRALWHALPEHDFAVMPGEQGPALPDEAPEYRNARDRATHAEPAPVLPVDDEEG
ncbi:MAG: ATP-binding cassette domain-containing protein [Coriobacteriales bacterium]|jgi:peptide/nickel transport system ATP-binding protein|nr:ATP-binding cassette domain-containing protein [Coriobacteriales bacterium]